MPGGTEPGVALDRVPGEKLERLLEAWGVLPGFIDFSGNYVTTPLAHRLRVLAAMGVRPDGEDMVDRLLAEAEQEAWGRWTAPVILADAEQCLVLRFADSRTEEAAAWHWRIRLETGEDLDGEFRPADFDIRETRRAGDREVAARDIPLTVLPAGYHRISLARGTLAEQALIVASPGRCHEPQWLQAGCRLWGVSAQLYTLRTDANWGMGDFADLNDLITRAAGEGADFVLLNPLHAPDLSRPGQGSPYSPTDRRFLNPLYIAPSQEEDFTASPEVNALVSGAGFQRTLAALRQRPDVDYAGVFAAKFRVFDLMFRHFQEGGARSMRGQAFRDFVDGQGEPLRTFAACQAAIPLPGVASGADPRFHLYLQWLAESQLARCGQLARERGMRVGLIRDLAVGSASASCEVRTNPALFCLDARVGAPPDDFNPLGQNWGLPPLRPEALAPTGFSHYITLLRANMRSCGALRIDHVMSLMRLWWCAAGAEGDKTAGAYVRYPVAALFAILRLESRRARCLVIGEDLGVVPPEIRSWLDASGLLSNTVFYFEKYDGVYFRKPEHYPRRVLAFIANHDVPTVKAWWNLEDLKLRRRLGLIPGEGELVDAVEYRTHEKRLLLQWLDELSILPAQWRDRNVEQPFEAGLGSAIIRGCGESNAQMVAIQLDDLCGLDTPVNIPGTDTEFPNWRRKLPVTVEALFADADARRMLHAIQETRDKGREAGVQAG